MYLSKDSIMIEQIQSMLAHGETKETVLEYLRKEYGTEDVSIEKLING